MEIFSTVLWHLRCDVELSLLAHELVEYDKFVPESWCAVGNCFSLQKEHDVALKFFTRAIQLDPRFTYAYTLCGHELAASDEPDRAMTYFRNALRFDERHYNAWYGIGTIYYRQEKFGPAKYHYERAIAINRLSSVLWCYLGMVLHSSNKPLEALAKLEEAIRIDTKGTNSLARFKRAIVLATLDEHEAAFRELEKLRDIAPKEAPIYFAMAKIYKKTGDRQKALQNFYCALDLDSKSASEIKAAIDRLDQDGEDPDDIKFEL
eukprot:TRINITY_DN11725_c0_g1_i1.p1 TRINITY_DN11725_c0_g1~~TRINITY_DN11725_c0_g1_i1.p1  ORF type:complete len:263 (+),score=100.40 TRINITY_DN11725_c0_g1_i1:2-790(+)